MGVLDWLTGGTTATANNNGHHPMDYDTPPVMAELDDEEDAGGSFWDYLNPGGSMVGTGLTGNLTGAATGAVTAYARTQLYQFLDPLLDDGPGDGTLYEWEPGGGGKPRVMQMKPAGWGVLVGAGLLVAFWAMKGR